MKHFLHIANPITNILVASVISLKSEVSLLLGLNNGSSLKAFALFE